MNTIDVVDSNLTLSSIVESIPSLQFTIRGMILSQKLTLVFVVHKKMKSKKCYKDKKIMLYYSMS